MAIISKEKMAKLQDVLSNRYRSLYAIMNGRDLKNANEGAKGGHWKKPELMLCINQDDLALAIGDMKSILTEISKLK